MIAHRPSLAVLLVLCGLAGCVSPNPNFYTLAALPGVVVTNTVQSVELRRIGIAGYLDRPDIVRSAADYRLNVEEGDRWGEPMGSMLGRVLTEDLVERLPNTSVFEEAGAISTQPDIVLEIDVQRFDTDADGTVVLLAQVAVRHEKSGAPAEATTIRLTVAPASPSTRDLAAAMSAALARLADRITGLLHA